MNQRQTELERDLAVLTLQITKANFQAILVGEQKVETRLVFPNSAKRYFSEQPTVENYEDLRMFKYDALKLINGRRPNAPVLIVGVESCEYKSIIDDDDKLIVLEEKGIPYPALEAYYHLGDVVFSENTD